MCRMYVVCAYADLMPNDDAHAPRRFVLLLVLGMVLLLALMLGLAYVIALHQERDCAARGAHRVTTGQGRYLCVDGTGRIVSS